MDPDPELRKAEIEQELFRLIDHGKLLHGNRLPIYKSRCKTCITRFVPRRKPEISGQCADVALCKPACTKRALYPKLGDCRKPRSVIPKIIKIRALRDRVDPVCGRCLPDFLKEGFLTEVAAVLRIFPKARDFHLPEFNDFLEDSMFRTEVLCFSKLSLRKCAGSCCHRNSVFTQRFLRGIKKEGGIDAA